METRHNVELLVGSYSLWGWLSPDPYRNQESGSNFVEEEYVVSIFLFLSASFLLLCQYWYYFLPWVLWHCWLDVMKDVWHSFCMVSIMLVSISDINMVCIQVDCKVKRAEPGTFNWRLLHAVMKVFVKQWVDCVGEQELEGLAETDQFGASHDMVRASPLPSRLGATVIPGSQGQLSRSDAHSFSYSLGPSTKGL